MPPARPRNVVLSLLLLTFAAYAPTFRNGFIWDDDAYVTENPALRSADGLNQIWTDPAAVPLPQYYPMTFTTFWAEHHLCGDRPLGYHIDNALLQSLNAILLWLTLRRLGVPGAFFAAAVFAVHPVGVESVAWITERKNVLSAAFYLSAFLAYPIEPGGKRTGFRYAAAFCLFLLALCSKTVTASLPAAIALVIWWRTGRVRLADVLRLLPFLIAGLIAGSITSDWERNHVGAIGPEWSSLTLIDRVLIAGRAVWFYAEKLACPWPLSFIYPRWKIDPAAAWQWRFPAAAAGVVAALWFARQRLGRGPLVAALLFVGTLFPALGFADVYPMRYSFVADHFQYLAMIPPIAAAAAVVSRVPPVPRRMVQITILVAFTTLTAWRCNAYRDQLALWTDTAAKNPGSWMVHNNLAAAEFRAGRPDEANRQYLLAARLGPEVPDSHSDAAGALARMGRFPEAEAECRRALKIDPGWSPAYRTLSHLLGRRGAAAEAAAADSDADGYALLRQHRPAEAAAAFHRAMQIDPADAGARRGYALATGAP
jgi:hypothetical protein